MECKRKIVLRQVATHLSLQPSGCLAGGGKVERVLHVQTRRALLQQIAPEYRNAEASQKQQLLEGFVAATGYVRNGYSTTPKRCYKPHNRLLVVMDRMSSRLRSWSGGPPTASAPNA